MNYLCDTNIMWRCLDSDDPAYTKISIGIEGLLNYGADIYITPQNLIEYHCLATRPKLSNGLGLTLAEADSKAMKIETHFSILPDSAEIYPNWRRLIRRYSVKSRQVHEARLVAVMLTYGVTHILTRNAADFRRYKEITVVDL